MALTVKTVQDSASDGYCLLCLFYTRMHSYLYLSSQQGPAVVKMLQTELSHNLQQLSEKARSTTEFIQRLKGMSDKVTESCIEFERLVTAQCEALIQAIHDRREYLLEAIRMDKDTKIRILKASTYTYIFYIFVDQQSNCTGKLQQTTGLIQFCIEALKETDSAAFLQIKLMVRVTTIVVLDDVKVVAFRSWFDVDKPGGKH
uniref:BBC domain-containing protein n=1 Tax=Glossina pallidipes TaxID=7398 RepID=A0A1A9ZPX6_GLOPL